MSIRPEGGIVYLDIDINNCFPQLLWNELMLIKGGMAQADVPILFALVHAYKDWRTFLAKYFNIDVGVAKNMLAALFHLAEPADDLPLLWAMAVEMQEAVALLLDTQKNRHLLERFGERRSPSATRLHCALSAIEDNVITELEAELTRVGL